MAAGASEAATKSWMRAIEAVAALEATPERTLPRLVADHAARAGTAPALLSAAASLSYAGLADRVHRTARWALAQGIGKGDVVALLLPNCPDYVAIWLGITRIGGVAALLNTNLSGAALAHCIDVVAPKCMIAAADRFDDGELAGCALQCCPDFWTYGGAVAGLPQIDTALEGFSGAPLDPDAAPRVTLEDRALCIYTSGTTGLPKAANVSHRRLLGWGTWFAALMGAVPQDRMFNCLPLYHSVGGVVAVGAMLVAGGSVVVVEKFSARKFWVELARWDCTLFQYIGELCRYLVEAPTDPAETRHRIRLACGNGLRGDVWTRFQARFAVPHILEFYAATEGSFSLFNVEGKPGSIGRTPGFLAHRTPVALVDYDFDTDLPRRDESGFCRRVARGAVGEAIGRLSQREAGVSLRFEGYTDAAQSEAKILRDVFAAGDAWFRTGDLMRQDAEGFFYFTDRIGDTFRWKGENVAASEVEAVLAACPGVRDAQVYGVSVPGAEGRAGMAALVTDGLDLAALHAALAAELPPYARPLFLRLREEVERTETFKPRKQALIQDGFDPARTADPLYFDDRRQGAYLPLDAARFAAIVAGAYKL